MAGRAPETHAPPADTGHTAPMLILLLACDLKLGGDSNPVTGTEPCPMLDCRDTLSLTVLRVDGSPALDFEYRVQPPDGGALVSGSCNAEGASSADALCYGDGRVDVFVYGETLEVSVSEGDDAPYWSGTLTPVWTAPYDSEACGHYCYLTSETVQLVPCEGCG